eukprot:PhM_4_TR18887/c1_g1_i1/m.37553
MSSRTSYPPSSLLLLLTHFVAVCLYTSVVLSSFAVAGVDADIPDARSISGQDNSALRRQQQQQQRELDDSRFDRHNNNNNNNIPNNNNNNPPFEASLDLDDHVKLLQDRLAHLQARGRAREAVDVANQIAVLQQQQVQRARASSRMAHVEKLARKEKAAREQEKQRLFSPPTKKSSSATEAPHTPPPAFVLKVETVRYETPAATPAADAAAATGNSLPTTAYDSSSILDLARLEDEEDARREAEANMAREQEAAMLGTAASETEVSTLQQYEDVVIYLLCVVGMGLVLYLLSLAVTYRERVAEPCASAPRCPNVLQKVWMPTATGTASSTQYLHPHANVRQLKKTSSSVAASTPATPTVMLGSASDLAILDTPSSSSHVMDPFVSVGGDAVQSSSAASCSGDAVISGFGGVSSGLQNRILTSFEK